ncbi:ester cyclase [Actinacidiphila glaucinigra]|uniref:ester cyclase n=1 Tax=Actinacidiphila glaucinigra TaxID=235986 RepID=UPI003AF404E4
MLDVSIISVLSGTDAYLRSAPCSSARSPKPRHHFGLRAAQEGDRHHDRPRRGRRRGCPGRSAEPGTACRLDRPCDPPPLPVAAAGHLGVLRRLQRRPGVRLRPLHLQGPGPARRQRARAARGLAQGRPQHQGRPHRLRDDRLGQVVEGEKAVTRWSFGGRHTGTVFCIAASGRDVQLSGISIDRVIHGRSVEHWSEGNCGVFLDELRGDPSRHRAPQHQVAPPRPGPGEES